uniref:Uncharacterized protein n=1 Tax=Caenorhabditis japonica TaxID=281687 RepID=A0A8R1E5N5_CAEJA
MTGYFRILIVLFATASLASAMGIVYRGNNSPPKKTHGDWPDKFPTGPDGFTFACRQCCPCVCESKTTTQQPTTEAPTTTVKPTTTAAPTTTVAPSTSTKAPTTTVAPTTSTKAPTTSTVAPTTSTAQPPSTKSTFSIRTPTPPTRPETVAPGGSNILSDPQNDNSDIPKPNIDKPYKPDAALDPLDVKKTDELDFDIATVGTPKAPRKPIDPDA